MKIEKFLYNSTLFPIFRTPANLCIVYKIQQMGFCKVYT